jgi:thiamine biosynthesis protein ThiS
MNLRINGESRDFSDPSSTSTLATLIDSLGMKSDRVAVELNREIAPRDRWSQIVLKDGDNLEIVHFVGGGANSVSSPPYLRAHSEHPSG